MRRVCDVYVSRSADAGSRPATVTGHVDDGGVGRRVVDGGGARSERVGERGAHRDERDRCDRVWHAERAPEEARTNCVWAKNGAELEPYALQTVPAVAWNGAVPTDADRTEEGSIFVLFRSYSPDQGNWVGISELRADGSRVDQLVLDPIHATVDNFEGIALREEQGRTFLYIVSDDNFSGSQRTLLMKFELVAN